MSLTVLPFFLAIDPDSLRLPGFDASSLPYLVYFLLFMIGVLIFLHWRWRSQLEKNALSNRFMQILMRRNLTKIQETAVHEFFTNLNENAQNEILLSQKAFAAHLHEFLKAHPQLSAADRVEVFDKLLPGDLSQIEIKKAADLRSGEICALDHDRKSYLATVVKTKENQVLLSLVDSAPLAPGSAKLYAYRPQLGGYLLAGDIAKANKQSAIFVHSGAIEFRGDQHLMCLIGLRFEISPWPPKEMSVEIDGAKNADATAAAIDRFQGITDKISDRALDVHFTASMPTWVLSRQEYWELALELPDTPLVCRVKISPNKGGQFLVRLIDLSAAEHNRLYKFISANAPVREHL